MTRVRTSLGILLTTAALAGCVMLFHAPLMAEQGTVFIDSYKVNQELLDSGRAEELAGAGQEQDGSKGSASKRQLTKYEKCILGVFYQDRTLDAAGIVNGYPSHVGHDPVMTAIVGISLARKYGVTIGDEMFFPPDQLNTRTLSGMTWIAHEMKHVAQAGAFGPSQDFLQGYTSTIAKGLLSGNGANDAYMKSPFETDARAVAGAFDTLLRREHDLTAALAGQDPDKDVCGLVNSNFSAYKEVLVRYLSARERTTYEFKIGSFPFLFPKKVSYTFYKD